MRHILCLHKVYGGGNLVIIIFPLELEIFQ